MLGVDEWFPVWAETQIPGSRAPPGAVDSEAGRGAWESEFSGAPRVTRLHTCSAEVSGNQGAQGCLPVGLRGAAQPLFGRFHSQREHFSC